MAGGVPFEGGLGFVVCRLDIRDHPHFNPVSHHEGSGADVESFC